MGSALPAELLAILNLIMLTQLPKSLVSPMHLRFRGRGYVQITGQLLCRSCHEAKTLVDRGQESAKESHGTLSSYKYCKCNLCKKAKADYMSRYHK